MVYRKNRSNKNRHITLSYRCRWARISFYVAYDYEFQTTNYRWLSLRLAERQDRRFAVAWMSHGVDPFALQSDRVGESVLKEIMHLLLHGLRSGNAVEFAVLRKNISVRGFIQEWLGGSTFSMTRVNLRFPCPVFPSSSLIDCSPCPFCNGLQTFSIYFSYWIDRRFGTR